ncbi:hypothetical protein NS226_01545 [Aureimonas ureilytica]|uniref:Uncharacterized protein n=1 Tax=Aureimonas ureilytica TaxID=401562 RepID=A0A175RFE8_9HYPH|nr:hypothetical protein [Aureimonas ureilytica]KTQ98252.1 hypothetical protein NS226_01545 [Aureimonas ureilytica]
MNFAEEALKVLEAEMQRTAPNGEVAVDVSHCSGSEIIQLIRGSAEAARRNSRRLKGVRLAAQCFTRAGIQLTHGNAGVVDGVPVVMDVDFDKMELIFEE